MNGRGRSGGGKHERCLRNLTFVSCLFFQLLLLLFRQHSSLCICATLIELNSCEELPDNLKWKCEHQLALQV